MQALPYILVTQEGLAKVYEVRPVRRLLLYSVVPTILVTLALLGSL